MHAILIKSNQFYIFIMKQQIQIPLKCAMCIAVDVCALHHVLAKGTIH